MTYKKIRTSDDKKQCDYLLVGKPSIYWCTFGEVPSGNQRRWNEHSDGAQYLLTVPYDSATILKHAYPGRLLVQFVHNLLAFLSIVFQYSSRSAITFTTYMDKQMS
jgi:hypothetical protein